MTSLLSKPALLRTLFAQLRLAVRLLREPSVPIVTKAIPVLAALYVVSPLDFIPDVLPLVGEIDDLAIAAAGVALFLRLCPPAARAFHQEALAGGRPYSPMTPRGDVIDAEWRRE